MVAGGVWVYREYNRQVREAAQRVSFVNQVSHELKTPLTNIRMYAELLESDLASAAGDRSDGPRSHLKVIVEESQRLSRLIGNVLTFARKQRDQLTLRPRPAVVDDVIQTVLERFGPALERRGVDVHSELSAPALVNLDVDALEQILGNLLSNVEKYAAAGKRVEINSRQSDAYTYIEVRDSGPGIPTRHQERVFRPFQRLSNHIADTPGTGIGLTIARQLAQLHGGDLIPLAAERGARFEVRIRTPRVESEVPA
jgi:signal transduction histidine kinase